MKRMKEHVPVAVYRRRLRFMTVFCGVVLLLCGACKDDGDKNMSPYDPAKPVKVTEMIPDSGRINVPMVINGENFGTDTSKIKVLFDDKEAVILAAQNEHLYVLVPKQKGGEHTLKVVVDGTNEGTATQKFRYIVTSAVTTVAGNGEWDHADGNALEVGLYRPMYLDVDNQNNVMFVDGSSYVKLLSLDEGRLKTLMSVSDIYECCFSKDYSHFYVAIESSSQTRIAYDLSRKGNWGSSTLMNDGNLEDYPCSITLDDHDDYIIVGCYNSIARMDHNTQEITVLGELPDYMGYNTDYNMVYNPRDKYVYVSSYKKHVITRFNPYKDRLTKEDFEIYAGNPGGAGYMDGTLSEAAFNGPSGMDFDSEGNMYVADMYNHAIRLITPEGVVSTYAGGIGMGEVDGEIGIAKFNNPGDIAVAPDGRVFVADRYNYKIRCIVVQ